MAKKCPDRIRYQREHYACFDLNCKVAHDAEYIRTDLHEAALTTARKEARVAAFREMFKAVCPDCAEGDAPVLDQQARWYYHGEGNRQVGCSASKLRIEAAANTEEATIE